MVVYPRWRGELNIGNGFAAAASGLSPLARGTQSCVNSRRLHWRFIPAGAGNTDYQKTYWNFYAVYPRWRGEHHSTSEHKPGCVGLSPLARGTLTGLWIARLLLRFIPAGAGNTQPLRSARWRLSVYPRWRGEHSKHNLLLINDFLSQSQSTNFIVSHKQHIHYVKEHLIH